MSGHRKCRRLDGGKNEIVTCSVCRSAASSCRGLSSTAGRPGGRRTEGRRPGGRHTAGHRLRTANISLKVCTRVVKQMHMRVRVCMRACVHFCMYAVPVALQDQLEAQTRPWLSSAALSPRPPSPCRYSWKRGMLGGAQYPSPLSLISLSFSTASCKAPSIPPVVFRPLGAVVGGGGGGHGGWLGSHGGLLLDNLRLLHLEQGSD